MADMVDKVKNASNTTKLVATTITSIAIAWVGAWQTVNAANNNNPSLSDQQQTQVRVLVHKESPITDNDRTVLFQTLRDINQKLTSVQIIVAGDHVLIQHIANKK